MTTNTLVPAAGLAAWAADNPGRQAAIDLLANYDDGWWLERGAPYLHPDGPGKYRLDPDGLASYADQTAGADREHLLEAAHLIDPTITSKDTTMTPDLAAMKLDYLAADETYNDSLVAHTRAAMAYLLAKVHTDHPDAAFIVMDRDQYHTALPDYALTVDGQEIDLDDVTRDIQFETHYPGSCLGFPDRPIPGDVAPVEWSDSCLAAVINMWEASRYVDSQLDAYGVQIIPRTPPDPQTYDPNREALVDQIMDLLEPVPWGAPYHTQPGPDVAPVAATAGPELA
jgi:hypothetical protein